MTKSVNNLPNHYSNLEDLTLYRWDKYTQTKDNNWFLVDYDGREKKLISDEMKVLENTLIDEYFRLIDDRNFSAKIQKWARIDFLRSKYQNINNLLDRFEAGFVDMEVRYLYLLELKKWGFRFGELNTDVQDYNQIQEFRQVLTGISTQIALLSKELQEDGRKESQSLIKQLQIVELGLGYKRKIDPKETSVAEWIEMCKALDEKSKLN